MMTFVWVLVGGFGLVLLVFVLLWMNAVRASGKRDQELDQMIAPVLEAVADNNPSAGDMVRQAANQPSTRNHLYQRLKEKGRTELFPAEFRTAGKVAESDLTGWLMHPNELAAAPSQIELIRQIKVQEGSRTGSSFLFRFRAAPGHWAADRGWMAGTTGPYWDGEPEIGAEAHAFSELIAFDQMTEEEHVEFLKAAMNKKGLVVPS